MIYTTIGPNNQKQTYEGFRAAFVKTMAAPKLLAIAAVEGQPELWLIDPDNVQHAIAELHRFYRTEFGNNTVLISVYDRRGDSIPDPTDEIFKEETS